MRKQTQKWLYRLATTASFLVGLLMILVLNPGLLYADKTLVANYTIYHDAPIDPTFQLRINEATASLKRSELYDPQLKIDICLNDGSVYPAILKWFQGAAFGYGFYNKVVLMGDINSKENYTKIHIYTYNLSQLLAHEMTHCMQFNKIGFWHSNPVANHPVWKWEGYCEYISRRNKDQVDLCKNIDRLNATKPTDDTWGIRFPDGTYAPRSYYNWWLLMQYCHDVKKMTYQQILRDNRPEEVVRQEMTSWYNKECSNTTHRQASVR